MKNYNTSKTERTQKRFQHRNEAKYFYKGERELVIFKLRTINGRKRGVLTKGEREALLEFAVLKKKG